METMAALILIGNMWINPLAVNALVPAPGIFGDTIACNIVFSGTNITTKTPCDEIALIINDYNNKMNQN